MSAAAQLASSSFEARLAALQTDVKSLAQAAVQRSARLEATAGLIQGSSQQKKLSLIVFSGSLDRTAALRRENVEVKRTCSSASSAGCCPGREEAHPLVDAGLVQPV